MNQFPVVRALEDALQKLKAKAPAEEVAALLEEARRVALQDAETLALSRVESHTLAMFYTVQQRLFDDLVPDKVCEAVAEMAVNFLGTEDFVIFVRSGESFRPQTGMGKAFKDAQPFSVGQGVRGQLVKSGDALFGQNGQVVQACLVDRAERVVGYLEVTALLRHKARLTFEDRELLSLLRQRGGAALAIALERQR